MVEVSFLAKRLSWKREDGRREEAGAVDELERRTGHIQLV